MSETPVASIEEHFGNLEDERKDKGKRHQLLDIIIIAICGVICGAEGWSDVEVFGKAKRKWLEQFLTLPHGIPSHDTFGRVFAQIDPEQFETSFHSWIQAVFELTEGQVVAIDGKTVRRSHDRRNDKAAIHLVSAWATANHLVLGQVKVDDKSNEITAIPELLELLVLNNCIVTIDAMGCQREIAEKIIDAAADYVLMVKDNQSHLLEDISFYFDLAQQNEFAKVKHDYHQTVSKGHGRVETRECWTIAGEESLKFLRGHGSWKGLQTIVMVKRQRQIDGEVERETHYYISSLPNDAQKLLHAIRGHWRVENSLHWVLDVAMGEDDSRVRKDYGPQNLSLLRRLALSLLKQEDTAKVGIRAKQRKAGWDEDYLLKVLAVA
jgi:predicted transposase YbfD/YdcC